MTTITVSDLLNESTDQTPADRISVLLNGHPNRTKQQ